MKINKYFLLLLSVLSIYTSLNLKKVERNPLQYKVVLLGNIGEFKIWKKEKGEVMKDLNGKNNQQKTDKLFAYGKTEVSGSKCFYTPTGKAKVDLTNALGAKEFGLRNFDDLINTATFKLLAQEADNIAFLGNNINVEAEGLQLNQGGKVTMHRPDLWNTRVQCAWNMFMSQLVKLKLHTGANLDNKIDLLPGERSFDVDFDQEEEIINNFMQKKSEGAQYFMMKDGTLKLMGPTEKRTIHRNVRKLTVKVGERKINFVDFNSAVLLCMHPGGKTYYDKCKYIKNYQKKIWTFTKALEYYTTLVHVINSLEPHAWNVLRASHPPTNIRDGDTDFYWAKLMDKKSLIDRFREKKIRMFFASHINTQAVMSLPYKDVNVREKGDKKNITVQGAYCNLENLKYEGMGLLPNSKCEKMSAFVVNTLKVDVLLIFINGNSGRAFDPINTGTLSVHGNIIWAREYKLNDGRSAFGYSNVMFRIEQVQFEFYEMFDQKDNTYETKKVAEIRIDEIKNTA